MKILKLLTGLMVATGFSVQAETRTVELYDNYFDPAELTIEPGDTVRWVNKGFNEHNVKADNGSFRCAEDCDPPGKSYHGGGGGGTGSPGDPSNDSWAFTRTFNEEGEVPYHCEVHVEIDDMRGTITVKQSGSDGMDINFGHTGSWFNSDQDGQGLSLEVVPIEQEGQADQLAAYWFTFARGEPGGPNRQRWFTGLGPIDGSEATLEVTRTTGGVFDDPEMVSKEVVGTATVRFTSCTEGTINYSLDLNGDGTEESTGEIALTRLTPDVLCEEMASSGG